MESAEKGAPQRFIQSVIDNPTDECVIWPYGLSSGYGSLWIDGEKWYAHRYALAQYTGANPPDKVASHGPCHNRACCNPRHLSWATHHENNLDRERDGTLLRGEDAPLAKLKAPEVLAIFKDGRTQEAIAGDYGISRTTVSHIKSGKSWGWLTAGP